MQNMPLRRIVYGGLAFAVAFVAVLVSSRFVAGQVAPGERPAVRQGPPAGIMSAAERAQWFLPGPPWDGVGKGPIGRRDIDTFNDFPLFWLGESFAGYNLQAISWSKSPGVPGTSLVPVDKVTFIYGLCPAVPGAAARESTPSVRSCAAPVTVHVEPACRARPEWIEEAAKAGPPVPLRGAGQVQRFRDGHIRIWTGPVSIFIAVPADPALVDQAIAQLGGVGPLAAPGVGLPLAAPDFGACTG